MKTKTIQRIQQWWVITILLLCTLLLLSDLSFSQGISTKTISPKLLTKITLSQSTNTTILFPSQFSEVNALGIVFTDDKASKGKKYGTIQAYYSKNQPTPLLILRSLVDNVQTYMTVLMDNQLYTFALVTGDNPDVSLTLTTGNAKANSVTPMPAEVDADTVKQMRPRYDPQLLADIFDLSKEAPLIQASYPAGYEGYSARDTELISDDGFVRTTVRRIQKFQKYDAIVISGKAENLTAAPIKFDLFHVSMAIGDALRPLTVLYPARPIPANKSFEFTAIVVGDVGGGRADLSLSNEYRLVVDSGHHPVNYEPPTQPSDPPPVVQVLPPSPLLPKKGDVK